MSRRNPAAVPLAALLALVSPGIGACPALAAVLRPIFSNPATGSLYVAAEQGRAFLQAGDPGLSDPRAALVVDALLNAAVDLRRPGAGPESAPFFGFLPGEYAESPDKLLSLAPAEQARLLDAAVWGAHERAEADAAALLALGPGADRKDLNRRLDGLSDWIAYLTPATRQAVRQRLAEIKGMTATTAKVMALLYELGIPDELRIETRSTAAEFHARDPAAFPPELAALLPTSGSPADRARTLPIEDLPRHPWSDVLEQWTYEPEDERVRPKSPPSATAAIGPLSPGILSHPLIQLVNGRPTAASAVRALMKIANDQALADPRELAYAGSALFVPAEAPLTLHAYRSRSSIADLTVSRVALELPRPGEPTLWGALDGRQREVLVLTLQEIFRRGHYVEELTDEGRARLRPEEQVRWDNALLAAHLADQPLGGDWDEVLDKWPTSMELRRQRELFERVREDPARNRPLGISPRRLLLAAHAGWDSAICRDVNQAFVGLLLELGVPAAQLRLVAGGESDAPRAVRHLFAEIQWVAGGPWVEIDGTPPVRRPGQPAARRDERSLRSRFPHRPREFPRFFEPIPVRRR